jgi:hypothetical protein
METEFIADVSRLNHYGRNGACNYFLVTQLLKQHGISVEVKEYCDGCALRIAHRVSDLGHFNQV